MLHYMKKIYKKLLIFLGMNFTPLQAMYQSNPSINSSSYNKETSALRQYNPVWHIKSQWFNTPKPNYTEYKNRLEEFNKKNKKKWPILTEVAFKTIVDNSKYSIPGIGGLGGVNNKILAFNSISNFDNWKKQSEIFHKVFLHMKELVLANTLEKDFTLDSWQFKQLSEYIMMYVDVMRDIKNYEGGDSIEKQKILAEMNGLYIIMAKMSQMNNGQNVVVSELMRRIQEHIKPMSGETDEEKNKKIEGLFLYFMANFLYINNISLLLTSPSSLVLSSHKDILDMSMQNHLNVQNFIIKDSLLNQFDKDSRNLKEMNFTNENLLIEYMTKQIWWKTYENLIKLNFDKSYPLHRTSDFFTTKGVNGDINVGITSSFFFMILSSLLRDYPNAFRGVNEEFLKLFPNHNEMKNNLIGHVMISIWSGMLVANTYPEYLLPLMDKYNTNWYNFLKVIEQKCIDAKNHPDYINKTEFQTSIINFLLHTRQLIDQNKFYKDNIINLSIGLDDKNRFIVTATGVVNKTMIMTPENEVENKNTIKDLLKISQR